MRKKEWERKIVRKSERRERVREKVREYGAYMYHGTYMYHTLSTAGGTVRHLGDAVLVDAPRSYIACAPRQITRRILKVRVVPFGTVLN